MRPFLVFVIGLSFISDRLHAQNQFENTSFEFWVNKTVNGVSIREPKGWHTLNALKVFGYEETTFESSEAKDGQKALMLETMVGPFNTIPGLLTVQNIIGPSGMPEMDKNRIAFTGRPGGLRFWYKASPEPGDTCVIFMMLSKWQNGKRDTIGILSFEVDTLVDEYTQAVAVMNYQSNDKPDSVEFIASSSKNGFSPIAGSWFLLDYLELFYTDALSETFKNQLSFYPNPCKETLKIAGLTEDVPYEIRNIIGEIVSTGQTSHQSIFGLNQIKAGVYLLCLKNNKQNHYQTIIIE